MYIYICIYIHIYVYIYIHDKTILEIEIYSITDENITYMQVTLKNIFLMITPAGCTSTIV